LSARFRFITNRKIISSIEIQLDNYFTHAKGEVMRLEQAYNLTVQTVNILAEDGIDVISSKPFKVANAKHTAAYEKTGELPKILWNSITFSDPNKEQLQKIFDEKLNLNLQGIIFDTGCFFEESGIAPTWWLNDSLTVIVPFKE
jgi:hypothetical protein